MLTELKIKGAKPKEKPYKLADEKGLYLLVQTTGGKLWRFDYRFLQKRKTLALGSYPEVTLANARERLDEARKMLANQTDPAEVKKAQKAGRLEQAANSFEVTARRWHASKAQWSEAYSKKMLNLMERDVFPWMGSKPIADLTPPDILTVVRRIKERGIHETADRALQCCRGTLRFAVAEGLIPSDPTRDIAGAVERPKTKHMASVTEPEQVAAILRSFDAFVGTFHVKQALLLSPLLFVRPGELRQAKWADIDFDESMWSIPAELMKMRRPHLVPLSTQAVAILKELRPMTGHLDYIFPNGRDPKRPMSDAAVNAAMRRLGIDTQNELTGHGFRAMARTLLHERLNFPAEVIEQQLAHKTAGPLGEAYARAKFIDQRIEMMQAWADYLDKLKAGETVTADDKAE